MLETTALALSKDDLWGFPSLPVWYEETIAERVVSKSAFQVASLTGDVVPRAQKLLEKFCIQI